MNKIMLTVPVFALLGYAAAPIATAEAAGHPTSSKIAKHAASKVRKTHQSKHHANRRRGTVSWYGPKFHGKKTASGQVFDMYAMTAAHKTLPLMSYAKVTNLKNNRSVIVRINDRGAFPHGREMDLSYGAAKKLGISGLGTVEITPLSRHEALPQLKDSDQAG